MNESGNAQGTNFPNTDTLMQNILKRLQKMSSSAEVAEHQRQRLAYVLAPEWDIPILGEPPRPPDPLSFPPDIERENELIMAFLHLREAHVMLSQCEVYFRRYPFRGTSVSREDHARNMCEFYFGCFYVIKNRLKETLNKLNALYPCSNVNIGKTVRAFEKAFDEEIRMRNSIQHHRPYEDVSIERILLARLLASNEEWKPSKSWKEHHLTIYRQFCRKMTRRVRTSARIVEALIDSVASVILREAAFIHSSNPDG